MYKIYFDNRVITISDKNSLTDFNNEKVLFCKSKKSFDNAYNLFVNDLSMVELIVSCEQPKKIFKYLKSKYSAMKAAGGIVINKNNELLVIKRNDLWDLPKGKVEKREGNRVAALREVTEECGISGMKIESKVGKTYHTYEFRGKSVFKTTHWYRMEYAGNESLIPQIEEDITEVKWIEKNKIHTLIGQTYESLKLMFLSAANL